MKNKNNYFKKMKAILKRMEIVKVIKLKIF